MLKRNRDGGGSNGYDRHEPSHHGTNELSVKELEEAALKRLGFEAQG